MSETELAWAAGFFDGEGCVSAAREPNRVYLRATVTQHGGDEARAMLQRFVDAIGVGKVRGRPYDYSGRYATGSLGKKPRYVVAYQNERDVNHVMSVLDPYLLTISPKRDKYHNLLAEAQRVKGGEQPS